MTFNGNKGNVLNMGLISLQKIQLLNYSMSSWIRYLPVMFLLFSMATASGQKHGVSGLVTSSEDQLPIIGATIIEKK